MFSNKSFRSRITSILEDQARPLDKFGHQPRLYALTRIVGKGLVYDDDIVFAAAFLHDIGVFVGHRPEEPAALAGWNHVEYASQYAPPLLRELEFPEEKIALVVRVIGQHQPRDTPESLEATILRDADILEQLGAIGILRAVAKTGRDTRYPTFTPVIAFLKRSLRELPPAIRLETTRALAEPRIASLEAFLQAVDAEAGEHLH